MTRPSRHLLRTKLIHAAQRRICVFQTFVPLAGDNATTVGVYGQMSGDILPVMSTQDKNFTGQGSVSQGVHVTSKVSISPTTSGQAG
jgi:hypothetical protein